jgi:hypothetical protein
MHAHWAAAQFMEMQASHAVFSPPSEPCTVIDPAAAASVAQMLVPESTGVPVSAGVPVSPPEEDPVSEPPSSPIVTSAPVPESSVVPVDELDEHPTELTLTPAPATIKTTTDKASFFIAVTNLPVKRP